MSLNAREKNGDRERERERERDRERSVSTSVVLQPNIRLRGRVGGGVDAI
jgi:hypothetical protein